MEDAAINERGMTMQQGMDYLISKHGLERNVYYAFRDAVKEKLADDVAKERKKLEKNYAAKAIDEKDCKDGLKALEKLKRDGVYERMQMVRETLAYKRTKEDYDMFLRPVAQSPYYGPIRSQDFHCLFFRKLSGASS